MQHTRNARMPTVCRPRDARARLTKCAKAPSEASEAAPLSTSRVILGALNLIRAHVFVPRNRLCTARIHILPDHILQLSHGAHALLPVRVVSQPTAVVVVRSRVGRR